MKNPETVYEKCIEFEERAAAIYLKLASRFSKDRELGSIWFEMAMQEKQHAGLLQFCLYESLFPSDLPDNNEIRKITELLKRLEKRTADPALTAAEAFAIAIELETSEVNAIYGHLTTSVHSSMYLFRRRIATSIPNHADELLAAARKFGVGEESLKELNRLKQD
jgi:rubrerythrin